MNSSIHHDRGRAILALVIGAIIIGAAPVLVRLAGAGPVAVGFWRLALSLPFLAMLSLRPSNGLGHPSRLAILAGCVFFLDLSFWHNGIANTSVAKATILANVTPVIVTALSWLIYKHRPTRLFLVATALSLAGAWMMVATRGFGAVGPNPLLGDALSLAAAFWYSLYFLAVSAARRTQGTTQIMFWSGVTGCPLLLAASWLLGERLLPATSVGWTACVLLGVTHVTGQGAIAWALGRLPPATAAITVLIQPVVSTALGWLLFNELFGFWQAVGAVLALTGVVLAQWSAQDQSLN